MGVEVAISSAAALSKVALSNGHCIVFLTLFMIHTLEKFTCALGGPGGSSMTVTMEVLSALRLFAVHLWNLKLRSYQNQQICKKQAIILFFYSCLSIEQSTRYFDGLTHCADPGLGIWCPSMFASFDFSA